MAAVSLFMELSPKKKEALLKEGYVLVIGLTTTGHGQGFELLAKSLDEEGVNHLVFIQDNVFSSSLSVRELNADSHDLRLSFLDRLERLGFKDEFKKIMELTQKPVNEVESLEGECYMLYNLTRPDVEMKFSHFELIGRSPRLHWRDDMPPYNSGDVKRRFKTAPCGCRLEQGEDHGRLTCRPGWLVLTPCQDDKHKG